LDAVKPLSWEDFEEAKVVIIGVEVSVDICGVEFAVLRSVEIDEY
jgi:hypothetical protein